MKSYVRSGLKRGLALLMAALLPLSALSVPAYAAGRITVDTADDLSPEDDGLTSLREAVAQADSGDTIVFSDTVGSITLCSALRIDTELTIQFSGQIIDARYDPETGSDDPLSVFTVEQNGKLTLSGDGTVISAVRASDQAHAPDRCALYVKQGGSLSIRDKVSVKAVNNDSDAFLIGISGGTKLSLTTEGNIQGGAFGVKALNGATGYSVRISMPGEIRSNVALGLTDPQSITLTQASLCGSSQAFSLTSGMTFRDMIDFDSCHLLVEGSPATQDQMNAGPESTVKNYIVAAGAAPAAPTDDPNVGSTDDPNVGSTDDPNAGSTDDPNAGSTDDPNAGSTDDPNAGSTDDPNAGSTDDPNAGSTDDPNAGSTDDPNAGSTDDPNAGSADDPNAGSTDDPNAGSNDPIPSVEDLAWKETKAIWSAVSGAKKYELQLFLNGTDAKHKSGDVLTVSGTSRDLKTYMTVDGKYYYKVRPVIGDRFGDWSEPSGVHVVDTHAPEITSRKPTRTSINSATFYFTSSEPGVYYFIITAANVATPSTDTVVKSKDVISNNCSTMEQKLNITMPNVNNGDPREIFLVVEDSAGNRTNPYRITIPAWNKATPTPKPTATPTPKPTQAPKTYTVKLPSGTGYSASAASGSASPVKTGGSYSFTLSISNGYTRGAGFAVKSNGVTLTAYNNVYTISNITADQVITVTGVVAVQNTTSSTTTVAAVPSITTGLLPTASKGQPYSQQLTAVGGTPITWSYTGSLPTGMTLSNTGLLSGTPTAEGTYRFTLKASNSTGSVTRQLTLVVTGTEYTVTEGANANWMQGSEEGLTFKGSGDRSFTVQVDGAAVSSGAVAISDDRGTVTLTPEFLSSLSSGTHTVTLVYPDGNAKARFNIKARTNVIPPNITAQPQSAEVNEGADAVFTMTASGTTPLVCQWQVDKNDGAGWVDVEGARSASLTVHAVTGDQSGWKYRCVVSNAAGESESNTATLTVRDELGTVVVVKETDPHPSRIGKVILGSALVLALAGIGGGVWWYLRRRREFEDDFEEEDEEDNL